uniref:uncharacterized protein LOC120340166 isoform X2 n=1 Tax=Styela clava TaxID=7725 RepID=UPI00193A29E5|nr:uncharacterized protein LOC120340166 isoform X2 [Styela clava]
MDNTVQLKGLIQQEIELHLSVIPGFSSARSLRFQLVKMAYGPQVYQHVQEHLGHHQHRRFQDLARSAYRKTQNHVLGQT